MSKQPKKNKNKMTAKVIRKYQARLAEIKAATAELSSEQMDIRYKIAAYFNPDGEGTVTTNHKDLKIKVECKTNYSITKANAALLLEEKPKVYAAIINPKPEVSVSGFKDNVKIAAKYVKTTPAPPTITITTIETE